MQLKSHSKENQAKIREIDDLKMQRDALSNRLIKLRLELKQ